MGSTANIIPSVYRKGSCSSVRRWDCPPSEPTAGPASVLSLGQPVPLPQTLACDFLQSVLSAPSCCRNATGCPDRLISCPWCELVIIFKHSPCIGVPGTCNAFCTQESWVGLFCIYFCLFNLFSSALKSLLCTWCHSATW